MSKSVDTITADAKQPENEPRDKGTTASEAWEEVYAGAYVPHRVRGSWSGVLG